MLHMLPWCQSKSRFLSKIVQFPPHSWTIFLFKALRSSCVVDRDSFLICFFGKIAVMLTVKWKNISLACCNIRGYLKNEMVWNKWNDITANMKRNYVVVIDKIFFCRGCTHKHKSRHTHTYSSSGDELLKECGGGNVRSSEGSSVADSLWQCLSDDCKIQMI